MRIPRIFFIFIFLVSPVLLLSGCAEPVTTGQTWDEFRRQWQAKGEVFDYGARIPAPVPTEKNFAHAPLLKPLHAYNWNDEMTEAEPSDPTQHSKAISLFRMPGRQPSFGQWQAGHAVDLVAWQEYFHGQEDFFKEANGTPPTKAQSDQAAADVLHALTVFGEEMAALLAAAKERSLCRFDVRYEAHLNARSPHLQVLMQASKCYTLRAVAHLAGDDNKAAFADTEMTVFLAQCLAGEPTLIAQLVRITILQNALQAIWQGLVERQWTDEQLIALEQQLSGINLPEDLRLSLLCERDMFNLVIDQMTRKPFSEWQDLPGLNDEKLPSANQIPWLAKNQIRLNEIFLKFGRNLVDVENGIIHPAIAIAQDAHLKKLNKDDPHNLLAAIMCIELSGVAMRFGTVQTGIDHARIAGALEQHRMKDGKYPGQLSDLGMTLPREPFSGNSYSYAAGINERYRLHGAGWNLADDGGRVIFREDGTSVDSMQGDPVWQYSPTPGS
ncbi:MAG: hypothetical protein VCA55_02900 [Verrucomicrobiales bacterium]